MRKPAFAYAKTKPLFSLQIVQSLFFLDPLYQASSHLLWLYSPVCVGPGRKPRKPVFSKRGSFDNVETLHKGLDIEHLPSFCVKNKKFKTSELEEFILPATISVFVLSLAHFGGHVRIATYP